jgi:hypothetical protein
MTRAALLVVIILAFAGSYARAQPPGRITGRVLDQTGAPLPGVTIELIVHSKEVTTFTDDAGLYHFDNIRPGRASTCRGSRVNLRRASPIFTRIRRCRAPSAWACSCRLRPGGVRSRAGLKTRPYEIGRV